MQYWVDRHRQASEADRASGAWALDRPSTPLRQPGRVSEEVHDRVCEQRQHTGWGPRLIASELAMAHATVSRCLARRGMSRLPAPDREQVRRFEWPCPGDLLQMDTNRLHSQLGDLPAGRVRSARGRAALALRARSARPRPDPRYRHMTSRETQLTRSPWNPVRLKRYQQTLAREWAHGQRYRCSDARAAALPIWLKHYNYTRNHSSLSNRPPISRVRNDPRHNR